MLCFALLPASLGDGVESRNSTCCYIFGISMGFVGLIAGG